MAEDDVRLTRAQLGRWLFVGALLLLGIALYFWLAPGTRPVVHPAASEDTR